MKQTVWLAVSLVTRVVLIILLLCLLTDGFLLVPTRSAAFSSHVIPDTTKAMVEAKADLNGQPRITDVAAISTTDTEGIHGKQWMVKKAVLDYAQSNTECPPPDSTPPAAPTNLRIGAVRAGYGFLASHVTPIVANPIPDQAATEDKVFCFVFASNTFNDSHGGSSLTYTATLSPTGALPGWLTFTQATRTFRGTPLNSDVGSITVRVIASAGTTSNSDEFVITVRNTNDAPTVATAIADQTATEDAAFSFQFAAGTFNDVDAGETLTYSATLSSGATLPGWLTFTQATRTFRGTPLNGDVGSITVRVTASDGTASVSDDFILTVKAARSLIITNNYNPNPDQNAGPIDRFIVRLRIASADANQAAERLGPDTPPCLRLKGASVVSPNGIETIPKTAIPGVPGSQYEIYIGFGYWVQDCGGAEWQKYNLDTFGMGNEYHYINVTIPAQHSSGAWTIDIIQETALVHIMTLKNELGKLVKTVSVRTSVGTDPVTINIAPD